VMYYVAEWCSGLQCVAVCCSVLQCFAVSDLAATTSSSISKTLSSRRVGIKVVVSVTHFISVPTFRAV